MYKILVTKKLFDKDLELIRSNLNKKCELIFPEEYNEDGILAKIDDADVLFGNLITENILARATKIKFIQIPWTGVDFLNFELLRKYNIPVCNSHSNAQIVAEHALAMYLSLAKKIPYHDRNLRKGLWNRPKPDGSNDISPFSKNLHNNKIGIIGFGAIGQKIYHMLSVFDSLFFIIDNEADEKKQKYDAKFIGNQNEIDELYKNANVIFVCVPLTPITRGFINEQSFNKMQKDTLFINISRGEVIDEESLYYALKNKSIYGAAIDTWYNYPKPAEARTFPSTRFKFHELDNIVISPHRAGLIEDSLPHLMDAIENLNRFADQKPVMNVISLVKGY